MLLELQRISPASFQRLIGQLVVALGYGGSLEQVEHALGRSGDGAVEGLIAEDTSGLRRLYVLAERCLSHSKFRPADIHTVLGTLDEQGARAGVFITTAQFSDEARATAAALSKPIALIDGARLVALMIHHGVGCPVDDHSRTPSLDDQRAAL